jgi:hypothetical protein
MIRRYREDMMWNINQEAVFQAILFSFGQQDKSNLRMLLELHDNAVNFSDGCIGLIHDLIHCEEGFMEDFQLLSEYGADIHLLVDNETPTFVAVKYSSSFRRWLDMVYSTHGKFESLIEGELASRELPLYKMGWRRNTFRDLITLCRKRRILEMKGLQKAGYSFCQLGATKTCCRSADIEPWWEILLYRLRTSRCICDFLQSTEDCESDYEDDCEDDWETDWEDDYEFDGVNFKVENGVESKEAKSVREEVLRFEDPHRPNDTYTTITGSYSEGDMTDKHICLWRCWDGSDDSLPIYSNLDESLPTYSSLDDSFPDRHGQFYVRQDTEGIRQSLMSWFLARGGSWQNWYAPGEVYCWRCFAKLENISERDDVSSSEENMPKMPGSFIF